MEKTHFISSLPRSGSTLLSAFLRQNPEFSADISSPVCGVVDAVIPCLINQEFASAMNDEFRDGALRGIFEAYYPESSGRTVFGANRLWMGSQPLRFVMFPQVRLIFCVRKIGWVLGSFERMLVNSLIQISGIFQHQCLPSVYK